MKKLNNIIVALVVMLCFIPALSAKLYMIDTVEVVVFGEERTDLITLSDMIRPSLDGSQRSLEDHVLECLIFQDAANHKILPSSEAIDKHLMSVQRENNLSQEDLQAIFRNAGYTFEEGKEKFGVMSVVGQMLDFKIRSRLVVPEKDIVAYYDANPVYSSETYQLARAYVHCADDQDMNQLHAEVEQLIEMGSSSLKLDWSAPFTLNADDLAENRKFIRSMHVGQIAVAQEFNEGIELLKVMDHQERALVPLEKRFQEIANFLRQPKYEELFNQYKKDLFDNASIIYLDKSLPVNN